MTRLEAAIAELVDAIREEVVAATPATAPEQLLDVRDAAARLGVSRTTAYGEIQAGRLRSVKVGARRRLVPSSAVAEYAQAAR